MSDLLLTDTFDGGDIELRNDRPVMTSGFRSAAYLSLLTPETWQDMTRESDRRFNSRIPAIKAGRVVSNQTRLALIGAAEDALEWLSTEAGAEIEVDAEIASTRLINVFVDITGPQGSESEAYAVNWAATSEEMR